MSGGKNRYSGKKMLGACMYDLLSLMHELLSS